eukprot:scaffold47_cov258-Pinguiococcus_pyrenoidosus.AAC.79
MTCGLSVVKQSIGQISGHLSRARQSPPAGTLRNKQEQRRCAQLSDASPRSVRPRPLLALLAGPQAKRGIVATQSSGGMPRTAEKQVFGASLSQGPREPARDLEAWVSAEICSSLAKGDPAIRSRLEAIADLSGSEHAIEVALARTRQRLEAELKKLAEDPVVKASKVASQRKRTGKRSRRKKDDRVFELTPGQVYATRQLDAGDPYGLSGLLLERTPRTRLEVLPVLANSGEPAFEVGLKELNPLLPVFKLPRVSTDASFIQRLPREDTAVERKAKEREQEEVLLMKEALQISDEELDDLEKALCRERHLRNPESSTDAAAPDAACPSDAPDRDGKLGVETPRSPPRLPEPRATKLIRPSTPRVLREKGEYKVDELKKDLGESITSMCNFSSALKADVLAVREICPIPKHHPAQRFFKQWGAERLGIAFESIVTSLLKATWLRWRDHIRQLKRAERLLRYRMYQSSRRLYAMLVDALRGSLARGWVRWVAFLRLERAREQATLQNAAARRVQAAWRARIAKKKLRSLRQAAIDQLRREAASKIQSFARGAATRRLFAKIIREKRRNEAAQLLQRVGLGLLGRQKARAERQRRREKRAATTIQARLRGMWARALYREISEAHRRQHAALLVQRIARGRMGKQEVARRRLQKRQGEAAVRLQGRIRMLLAVRRIGRMRREQQERADMERAASILIQRIYRGRRDRLEHKIKLASVLADRLEKDRGATTIQAAVRSFVARRKVERLRVGRRERWIDNARQVQEAWDDASASWYYYSEPTGESSSEPPHTGYAKYDGRLVLANGEVIDDPYSDMSAAEVREKQREALNDLQECVECESRIATRWCAICDDPFCDSCWAAIHAHGKRQMHGFAHIHEDGSVSPRFTSPDGDDAGAFQGIVPGTTAAKLVNMIRQDGQHRRNSHGAHTGSYDSFGSYSTADPSYHEQVDPSYQEQVDSPYQEEVDPSYQEQVNSSYQEQVDSSYHDEVDPSYHEQVNSSYQDQEQEQALIVPAPEEQWYQYTDDDGYPFWYNANTGLSQYEDPYSTSSEVYPELEPSSALVDYVDGTAPSAYDPSGHADSAAEAGGPVTYERDAVEWQQYEDDDGNPYYYNPVTGMSQYESPYEESSAGLE